MISIKNNPVLKVGMVFISLFLLQVFFSIIFYLFFSNFSKSLFFVQLSIDLSHLLVVIIILLNHNFRKWFKPLSFVTIFKLFILSFLFFLISPIVLFKEFWENLISLNLLIFLPTNLEVFQSEFSFSNFYFHFRILFIMPFLEEMIYRGFFFTVLKEKYSVKWAVIISSFLFALGHFSLEQFFPAFFIGVFFAYLFEKYKNIPMLIILHFFINVFSILAKKILIHLSGIDSLWIGIYLVYLVLLVYAVKKFFKMKRNGFIE